MSIVTAYQRLVVVAPKSNFDYNGVTLLLKYYNCGVDATVSTGHLLRGFCDT